RPSPTCRPASWLPQRCPPSSGTRSRRPSSARSSDGPGRPRSSTGPLSPDSGASRLDPGPRLREPWSMADAGHLPVVAGLVARAIHTAVSCGLDRNSLLAELGVDPGAFEDRDGRLPAETFGPVWHLIARELCG